MCTYKEGGEGIKLQNLRVSTLWMTPLYKCQNRRTGICCERFRTA